MFTLKEVLDIINSEDEMKEDPPENIRQYMSTIMASGDTDKFAEAMRIAVRKTKENLAKRFTAIANTPPELIHVKQTPNKVLEEVIRGYEDGQYYSNSPRMHVTEEMIVAIKKLIGK
jgi:hypothetical protein